MNYRTIKPILSKAFLRGTLREWWIRSKTRKLEALYLKELIARSEPGSNHFLQDSPLPSSTKPLNRLLFIGDVLWEDKELIPELQKISEVDVLDLKSVLKKDPNNSDAHPTVLDAVRGFAKEHGDAEYECVLLYLRSGLLSVALFELIRSQWDSLLLGFNLDDKMEFLDYGQFNYGRENYRRWLSYFDVNITNVRAVVDWYRQEDVAVYYMPEGFHPRPELNRPEHPDEYQRELAFVGSWKPEREIFFRQLQSIGVPLEPVGFGWPNSEGGRNPVRIYRSTQINLGIGYASPSESLTTLKTRDFECPGSGACYLTTYNWELSLHYRIGKEILCYRDTEELVEMVSFYRRHPHECLEIAQRAWDRCRSDHTWEKRFSDLFRQMNLIS